MFSQILHHETELQDEHSLIYNEARIYALFFSAWIRESMSWIAYFVTGWPLAVRLLSSRWRFFRRRSASLRCVHTPSNHRTRTTLLSACSNATEREPSLPLHSHLLLFLSPLLLLFRLRSFNFSRFGLGLPHGVGSVALLFLSLLLAHRACT